MEAFLDALTLQAGYNAALVAIGAALLGFAAGTAGSFLFLRKRALVSDAVAHATLPGVGIAFLIMVALGGEGRSLIGLLLGSALSAWIGLLLVEWIAHRTRLAEDAAIGAVLSVFFGFGVVLLTVIQTLDRGRQAGLEDFLLGSTAGMLLQDAQIIAIGGALVVAAIWVLRRPMTLVSFDAGYAAAMGVDTRRVDLAMMGLVMAVTVIGLKLVGLILIVALLIIPAVTARFWTNRVERVLWAAGAIGGVSGYVGAALSASAPDLPTGPIIVLIAAALFALSLLLAPARGVLAASLAHRRFQRRVHRRQGLLALVRGEPIHDPLTLRILRAEGLIRADGVATDKGRAHAAKIARDERRWDIARRVHQDTSLTGRYDGLTPIEDVFTADQIADFDARLGPPQPVGF
ncbi:metal ABC transporter permease [Roseicyclus marinus]|uniref:metal ABC transporter permease n=1 Tax=Roseicyclus marinus TaxID=2161673 RepID=UPI00240EDC86|nr:iron chelate uptake ABC transporter family permease subunit [Roseicyclus marinus]MDG3040272.1 iron chelate uptake ABC transporter family permease subunit [Roseicyclus marinus]